MKKLTKAILVFCLVHNLLNAQSNSFPTTGNITVFDYSPLAILQRNTSTGGFIQGIQTKLFDGTNNWYFGNLHSDSWIVSKGDYQNPKLTILSNGKVGIGTMNPLSKLNSTNTYYSGTPTKENSAAFFDNQGIGLYIGGNEYNYGYIQAEQTDNITLKPLVLQPNGSNVGIGTGSPNAKLTINASANSNDNAILLYNNNTAADSYTAIGSYYANGNTNVNSQIRFGNEQSNSAPSYLAFATGSGSAVERMRITSNGNIGVGITNPTNKLDVNGTIHSKEVKVDMNGWSDFVFKKEYSLPTLEEVEKHITEKGHLANIPNKEEVLKNGINLGEMNAKLLQKIEEMTLYMIEQNKRMDKLEKENQDLKNSIDLIKK